MATYVKRLPPPEPAKSPEITLAQLGGGVPPPVTGQYSASVWVNENRVSSDGQTRSTPLMDLPVAANALKGITWTHVDGKTPIGGIFRHEPVLNPEACRERGECETSDKFDQVQLYDSLTNLAVFVERLGMDMRTVVGRSKNGVLRAHANNIEDMNAWFENQSEELSFGTSNGKWHLASDNDVNKHEAGHFILHRLAPGLSGWYAREGAAIHEGFSDVVSAAFQDDKELSEDFRAAIGEAGSKTSGLRDIDNEMTLGKAGNEEHDRGEVYGGFFWKLKKRLEDPSGPYRLSSRAAADLVAKMALNHAVFYSTNRPAPADFVRAVMRGTEALAQNGGFPVSWELLRGDIAAEAIKRELIRDARELDEPPPPAGDEPALLAWRQRKSYLGNRTFDERKAIEEYRQLSPAIHFSDRPEEEASSIRGSRRRYQEYYTVQSRRGFLPERLKVVGAGLQFRYTNQGVMNGVFANDVALIRPGQINEAVNVDAAGAVAKAKGKAAEEKAQSASRQKMFLMDAITRHLREPLPPSDLKQLELRLARLPSAVRAEYKNLQMRARIAVAAAARAEKLVAQDAELVLIPRKDNGGYETDIFYEFKMGLSLYYVNARTGAVKVEDDVVWD